MAGDSNTVIARIGPDGRGFEDIIIVVVSPKADIRLFDARIWKLA